jgi:hypothetical protein
MLGTRILATIESNAHPAFKQAVIAAHARDTALTICFQDGWPRLIVRCETAPLLCGMLRGVRRRATGRGKATSSRPALMAVNFFAIQPPHEGGNSKVHQKRWRGIPG